MSVVTWESREMDLEGLIFLLWCAIATSDRNNTLHSPSGKLRREKEEEEDEEEMIV